MFVQRVTYHSFYFLSKNCLKPSVASCKTNKYKVRTWACAFSFLLFFCSIERTSELWAWEQFVIRNLAVIRGFSDMGCHMLDKTRRSSLSWTCSWIQAPCSSLGSVDYLLEEGSILQIESHVLLSAARTVYASIRLSHFYDFNMRRHLTVQHYRKGVFLLWIFT